MYMNIEIGGFLISLDEFTSKNGKTYYNASVVCGKSVYRIGIPHATYLKLQDKIETMVEFKNIHIFISDFKAVNLYVKD